MNGAFFKLFFCTGLCSLVQGHSWLSCTDYAEKNGEVYNHGKCRGWPRGANNKASISGTFGLDTGFDHKPSEALPCQLSRDDNNHYDDDHPMAVYYPGQQIVLAHPMKNHGADERCTSRYIPDHGNKIYRGLLKDLDDPSFSSFKKNLVFDLSESEFGNEFTKSSVYPKPGFQNAPKFCEDTDKSLGTYSFNLPDDLAPGQYTFLWAWSFNSDQDIYSTCFEVVVAPDKAKRDELLRKNGINDLSVPCGGVTSDPSVEGSCWSSSSHIVTSYICLILCVLAALIS